MSRDRYVSPLSERYASREMQYIFSPDMKFRTWRKLWIALAETEMELGLSRNGEPVITVEQIQEMRDHAEEINYDVAREREREVRHDVMSHVYAYGQQCPKAAGIIHLGATSCYVGDNTDIIVMTQALRLVKKKLVNVMAVLGDFAEKYKAAVVESYEQYIRHGHSWCWGLLGNIVNEHEHGEEREIKFGTKHFSCGTKVFIAPAQWGDGYEKIIVIGLPRHGRRYIEIIMQSKDFAISSPNLM